MSMIWIIVIIFYYLQYSLSSKISSPASLNAYDNIHFYESSNQIRTVSNFYGAVFKSGDAVHDYRIFGLNDSSDIAFDICAPATANCDNPNGVPMIQLCYFHPNAEGGTGMHECDLHFCLIQFEFVSQNSTHKNILVTMKDPEPVLTIPISSSSCVSGHLKLDGNNKSIFQATGIGFNFISACEMKALQFENAPSQTAIYLKYASSTCSPTITISTLVNEYFAAPTTTTTTTTSTTPTVPPTTTTVASTTPFNVKNWFSSYWWAPILSALFLISTTSFLCVLSYIFRKRSASRVNELYRRVLIRRYERKKEMERNKTEDVFLEQ